MYIIENAVKMEKLTKILLNNAYLLKIRNATVLRTIKNIPETIINFFMLNFYLGFGGGGGGTATKSDFKSFCSIILPHSAMPSFQTNVSLFT